MFFRIQCLAAGLLLSGPPAPAQGPRPTHLLPTAALSRTHFGNDHAWYERNIPFFACPDTALTRVYYYRWQLYKAHLKNLGEWGYISTEFLNEMSWDRKPYSSLNDATGFHLYEGRWLRDNRYARDYISYLYQHGGNDRHFSEYIADATWANHLVHPDQAFVTAQLPAMRRIYDDWRDHFNAGKGLYYIEPLLDATEYTISSIDASGGRDGFRGGDAFRPSINSYQYANAQAIARVAGLAGDTAATRQYAGRARALRQAVQAQLWQPEFQHFTDRYQVTNQYVTYWNFIRGRELAGYVPWAFGLPEAGHGYEAAWAHLLDARQFAGPHGLRTNEPSYEYYMRQYRYLGQERECQWNGPSWPFQTSQVLLGMARVLHAPGPAPFAAADYLRLLTQYAHQHYIDGRHLNIVEDYDADRGAPIVNLAQRSEHYFHSEFNDLVITGLCGVQPAPGDSLRVQPLLDAAGPLGYFCLENVPYHGHLLMVLYDRSGRQYRQGAGLSVYVNGQRRLGPVPLGRYTLALPPPVVPLVSAGRNLAVSLTGKGLPEATASFSAPADGSPQQAIDGRTWYFQNVRNHWSGAGSPNATDWLSVRLPQPQALRAVVLHFYADGQALAAPRRYQVECWQGGRWQPVQARYPRPLPNTGTRVEFAPVTTDQVRVVLTHAGAGRYAALAEVEVYE